MDLEQQIETLNELGLVLNEGIAPDDFLISFSREEYEKQPFDLILIAYGIEVEEEPWGRYFCDQAWNFDIEAIDDDGSYVEIVNHFHRISGKLTSIENLQDRIDIDESIAELQYTIDGEKRRYSPVIDNDWADPSVVESIMNDLRQPGFDFYAKDNGQASVWYFLTEDQARSINSKADNVFNLNLKPWWKVW